MSQTLSSDVSGALTRAPQPTLMVQRVQQLRGRVEEYIRREPAKAILIAAVAGLVTGRLIRVLAQQMRRPEAGPWNVTGT